MYTQTTIIALLAAVAQARFNQEQGNGAIDAISALSDLGQPGEAATLAGGSIQFLLAAANPCGKLQQADKIVAALGTSDRAIAAARGLVAAEQNTNPFVVSIPNICSEASLPATAELRGVVPLIDPAVVGQEVENANSATSKTTPFPADGLSVAQVMVAQGFSNFTAVALDGTKTAGSSLGDGAAAAPVASSAASSAAQATTAPAATGTATGIAGCPPVSFVTVTRAASSSSAAVGATSTAAAPTGGASTGTSPADGSGAVSDPVTGTFEGFQKSTIAGLDFGKCTPTIKFEAGLNGRKETESTFQAIDPLVNKGQQEALNPNIITNRIKDQLTNVCGANQAAKDAAVSAMAQIQALGTRDKSTADAWNTALGFAGTNTNPDNAPQAGLVGHT